MTTDHVNEEVQVEKIEPSTSDNDTNDFQSSTQSPEEFLANFDWVSYQEAAETVDEKKYKEFEKLVHENFVDTQHTDVIQGIVTHMTEREAIIDINAKSEGVISLNEFRYNPDLKVGDSVEVIVDIREDKTGQLVLSHRKARVIKAWDRVNEAHNKGEVVTGFVKCPEIIIALIILSIAS